MNRFIITIFATFFLSGCVVTPTLYDWNKYNDRSYNYLKNADEMSMEGLLAVYELIINNPKGTRNVPPPGVMADYGFFLIQKNEVEKGRELLEKEMLTYPESRPFVERILNMLES
jgi:hypothetical protein